MGGGGGGGGARHQMRGWGEMCGFRARDLPGAAGDGELRVLGESELEGKLALRGELLDLLDLVGSLPGLDVVGTADTEGTTGIDERGGGVTEVGGDNEVLVVLGGTGLNGCDETGTDPDRLGAVHERGGEATAVGNTTGSDDVDGLAGQGRGLALDAVDALLPEDGGGGRAGVATTLTTLGADDVDAALESLLDVLGGTDHVHDKDVVLVETVDDVLGRDTDGTDEELGTLLNDDGDELVELALGVVVVGLTSGATDLGKEEVNTEG